MSPEIFVMEGSIKNSPTYLKNTILYDIIASWYNKEKPKGENNNASKCSKNESTEQVDCESI